MQKSFPRKKNVFGDTEITDKTNKNIHLSQPF